MRMERALSELDAALKAWDRLPFDASPEAERPYVQDYLTRFDAVLDASINTDADAFAALDYFLQDENREDKAAATILSRAISVLAPRQTRGPAGRQ